MHARYSRNKTSRDVFNFYFTPVQQTLFSSLPYLHFTSQIFAILTHLSTIEKNECFFVKQKYTIHFC